VAQAYGLLTERVNDPDEAAAFLPIPLIDMILFAAAFRMQAQCLLDRPDRDGGIELSFCPGL